MLTPFAGIRTFMKAPTARGDSHCFAVVGAPTDMATTFRTGARMAPAAIRDASAMLCDGEHYHYEVNPIESGLVWDAGDIEPVINDPAATEANLVEQLKQFEHAVVLGGDHSITLSTLKAAYERHGELALLHFDAHVDTWEGHNHGTFLREAIDLGLVHGPSTVQVGIRSPMPRSLKEWGTSKGIHVISAADVHLQDIDRTQVDIHRRLTNHRRPIFLTFDIDCLDPSVAPGTGTPEPGGLFMHQVYELLTALEYQNVVGMDLVEVLPAHDNNDITSIAAANIVWTYLSQRQVGMSK